MNAYQELKPSLPPTAEGELPGSRRTTAGRAIGGWASQKPGRTTAEFLAALHGAILFRVAETGSFNMKHLDHRSGDDYLGVSNKELTIHAAEIVGHPIRDYGLAKLVVLRTLMHNARLQHDFKPDPDLMDDIKALSPEGGFAEALPATASSPTVEHDDGLGGNAEELDGGEDEAEDAEQQPAEHKQGAPGESSEHYKSEG